MCYFFFIYSLMLEVYEQAGVVHSDIYIKLQYSLYKIIELPCHVQ